MVVTKLVPKETNLRASAQILGLQEAHNEQEQFCVGKAIVDLFILLGINSSEKVLGVRFTAADGSSSAAWVDSVARRNSSLSWQRILATD